MWKVTAPDPGRSFTSKSGAPGKWVHSHHSLEPVEGGARARLRLNYEGVIGRLMVAHDLNPRERS